MPTSQVILVVRFFVFYVKIEKSILSTNRLFADDFACVRIFDPKCDSIKDIYAPAKIDEILALYLLTGYQLFVSKIDRRFWRFGVVPAGRKKHPFRTRIYMVCA